MRGAIIEEIMDEQPVKQAFGSPGGKSYLAPRIVDMIPPHKTYVEPFAGGAAVFFRKAPSEREVLNDKDSEIAFAFRFLRDMTPQQYERLKRYDWRISRGLFKELKASKPTDGVERFRRFYYLKKGSWRRAGEHVDMGRLGAKVGIDRLPQARERLGRTVVHSGDAEVLVRRYNQPSTFLFLDPPYPDRARVGTMGGGSDRFTEAQLKGLLSRLKGFRGNYMLTLGPEHTRLMPRNLHIKRAMVKRKMTSQKGEVMHPRQFEIMVTNYNPAKVRTKPHRGVKRSGLAGLAGMRG